MFNLKDPIRRRSFLGSLAASAAVGAAALSDPMALIAQQKQKPGASKDASFDAWLNRIKGKHRQVFDAPSINFGLPLAWPRVFQMTNEGLGVSPKDLTAVLILRHDAIPIGMNNDVWAKYKFADAYKPMDMMTKKPILNNVFWQPKPEELPLPGMALNELLDSGVLVGICDMAITVHTMMIAKQTNGDAAEIKKEWIAGIFPGIQVVPSGVVAINRAQEHGCTYCYAGDG